ncbi:MAG: hypothetical protein HUJ94_01505, partial [Bacteroidales bacterium]|nr:hypothetical protein [Bacteroidales bacterium]
MNIKLSLSTLAASALAFAGCAPCTEKPVDGNIFETYSRFLTEPYGYVAEKAEGPIKVDGLLDEADWIAAPWTEDFADISGEGFPTPRFRTRAKMLWDDEYLYIG